MIGMSRETPGCRRIELERLSSKQKLSRSSPLSWTENRVGRLKGLVKLMMCTELESMGALMLIGSIEVGGSPSPLSLNTCLPIYASISYTHIVHNYGLQENGRQFACTTICAILQQLVRHTCLLMNASSVL